MINGTHALIHAEDAVAARAFFRDVLALPNVDAHDGWLIFRMPPAARKIDLYEPHHPVAHSLPD
jgi:hypothetical protein